MEKIEMINDDAAYARFRREIDRSHRDFGAKEGPARRRMANADEAWAEVDEAIAHFRAGIIGPNRRDAMRQREALIIVAVCARMAAEDACDEPDFGPLMRQTHDPIESEQHAFGIFRRIMYGLFSPDRMLAYKTRFIVAMASVASTAMTAAVQLGLMEDETE